MIFRETEVPGAWVVEIEPIVDERGFFARTYCEAEFRALGLNHGISQSSVSFNPQAATLRGMHYQLQPEAETKLVRCVRGRIFDAIVDLRPESPTFMTWAAVELTSENRLGLYVPELVAHGFLTLVEDCEVLYQISGRHEPSLAAGVRWDDPRVGIDWPSRPAVISRRDAGYGDLPEYPGSPS